MQIVCFFTEARDRPTGVILPRNTEKLLPAALPITGILYPASCLGTTLCTIAPVGIFPISSDARRPPTPSPYALPLCNPPLVRAASGKYKADGERINAGVDVTGTSAVLPSQPPLFWRARASRRLACHWHNRRCHQYQSVATLSAVPFPTSGCMIPERFRYGKRHSRAKWLSSA